MITPEQLYAMQADKSLSIGDAWNALGEAADTNRGIGGVYP